MKTIKKTLKNKQGFTLMEMVLVLFIISVLMLVAFRSLRDVERATAASHDGLSPFAAGAK